MSVKAYIITTQGKGTKLPHYFLSSIGPYLFRAEAEAQAQVITAATGRQCQLNVIHTSRILNDIVRSDSEWLTVNIWNIKASGSGFQGEAIIQGRVHIVQRSSDGGPWSIV